MSRDPRRTPPTPLHPFKSPTEIPERSIKKPKVVYTNIIESDITPLDHEDPKKASYGEKSDAKDDKSDTPQPTSPKQYKRPSASAHTRKTIIETYESPGKKLFPSPGLTSCGYRSEMKRSQPFDMVKPCSRGNTHLLKCGHMVCSKKIKLEPCGINCITQGPALPFDCLYCVEGEVDPLISEKISRKMGGRSCSEYLTPTLSDDVVAHMILENHYNRDDEIRAKRILLRNGKRTSEPATARVISKTDTTGPMVEQYLKSVTDEKILDRFKKLKLQDVELPRPLKRVREESIEVEKGEEDADQVTDAAEAGLGDGKQRASRTAIPLPGRRYTKTYSPRSPEPVKVPEGEFSCSKKICEESCDSKLSSD